MEIIIGRKDNQNGRKKQRQGTHRENTNLDHHSNTNNKQRGYERNLTNTTKNKTIHIQKKYTTQRRQIYYKCTNSKQTHQSTTRSCRANTYGNRVREKF